MFSYAYDGSRCCKWYKEVSLPYGRRWLPGDVIGCALDLDTGTMSFSQNGKTLGVAFENVDGTLRGGLCPAASMDKFQWCRFNFGETEMKYLPEGYMPVQCAAISKEKPSYQTIDPRASGIAFHSM
jgi:Kip1 ubiquitination-promoting complex protein 1